MKIVTNIVNKIGSDKLIHFLVGAVLVSLFYPLGKWFVIGSSILTIAISVLKEIIDSKEPGNKFDILDLIAGSLGAIIMMTWFLIM